jgi:very-short-patch-repair endonuclease
MSKRTREQILEQMHPEVSKMELEIQKRLSKSRINYFSNHPFCLLTTVPDLYFPEKGIAIYLDGPVHKGKEGRDEDLREKLATRHNIKVISIEYRSYSKSEVERVWKEIQEAIER